MAKSDDADRIIDTLVLIGLSKHGRTISTQLLSDDLLVQELYYAVEPVSKNRSVDSPAGAGGSVLTFTPTKQAWDRLGQWYDGGKLIVPDDFHLTQQMAGFLVKANSRRVARDEGKGMEIQTPPLDSASAHRIRSAFTQEGFYIEGGTGIDALRLAQDDAQRLREYGVTPSNKHLAESEKYNEN